MNCGSCRFLTECQIDVCREIIGIFCMMGRRQVLCCSDLHFTFLKA